MRLIISTRPAATNAALEGALGKLQLPGVNLPGMLIAGPDDPGLALATLLQTGSTDIWLFTSINAIEQTFGLLRQQPLSAGRWPRMAVLGKGSLDCLHVHLQQLLITAAAIIMPPPGTGHDSEALLQHPLLQDGSGRRILILNAPGGRDKLLHTLQARGARVEELAVYQRLPAKLNPAVLQSIYAWPDGLLTLWTSSTSIHHLRMQLQGQNAAPGSDRQHHAGIWKRIIQGRHLVLSTRQQAHLQALDAVTIAIATAPDTHSLAQQLQELCLT